MNRYQHPAYARASTVERDRLRVAGTGRLTEDGPRARSGGSFRRRAYPGSRIATSLRSEAHREGIHLVPLRVFIGLGWLRACAEKAIDPGWRDGTSLSTFLHDHLRAEAVALPPYEPLVTGLFLPHATVLSWIVTLGQLFAGLAILTGCLTRAALLGGLVMNLNFLLAGEPTPSAFYLVIQAVLLLANAGTVLGLDAHLAARGRPCGRLTPRTGRIGPGAALVMSLGVTGYALANVTDWGPAGSVHDPAMVLAVLALMAAGWSTIAFLRVEPRRDNVRTPKRLGQGILTSFAVPGPPSLQPLPEPVAYDIAVMSRSSNRRMTATVEGANELCAAVSPRVRRRFV